MTDFRTIAVGRRSKNLHIEAPGCIINVYHSLSDREGRRVVRVEVLADHYAGEAPWCIEGEEGKHHHSVRVICVKADPPR